MTAEGLDRMTFEGLFQPIAFRESAKVKSLANALAIQYWK